MTRTVSATTEEQKERADTATVDRLIILRRAHSACYRYATRRQNQRVRQAFASFHPSLFPRGKENREGGALGEYLDIRDTGVSGTGVGYFGDGVLERFNTDTPMTTTGTLTSNLLVKEYHPPTHGFEKWILEFGVGGVQHMVGWVGQRWGVGYQVRLHDVGWGRVKEGVGMDERDLRNVQGGREGWRSRTRSRIVIVSRKEKRTSNFGL
eukprot:207099-Hanusia_phi.AAC.17